MIPWLRQAFNRRYRVEDYPRLLGHLRKAVGAPVEFRVAETPCFFRAELMQQAAAIGGELTSMLVGNSPYLQASSRAIPEAFRMPDETPHPHFMTADFGLARNAGGELELKTGRTSGFPVSLRLSIGSLTGLSGCFRTR